MISTIKNLIRDQYKFQNELFSEVVKNRTLMQKQLMTFFRHNELSLRDPILDYSVYSESNEDAIVLYLLSKLNVQGNFRFIDIGGGRNLKGSNTANLFIHHGAQGLIIEGNADNCKILQNSLSKYGTHLLPIIINKYVGIKNVNQIIQENLDISKDIHLLSLDIDSIDLWIWEALTVVSPYIVVVEFQCVLKAEESLVVPKNFSEPTFVTRNNRRYAIHNSGSLKAFEKLAAKKGYRLIGTSELGFNAIFVKNELPLDHLKTISVEEGLDKEFVRWAQREFYEDTKKLEWDNY